MNRMGTVACAFLVAVTAVACGTDLSAAGGAVKMGKMEPTSGCKELGPVYGSGGGGGYTSSEEKLRSAQNQLRNRTARLGGNYVAMDAIGGDIGGMTVQGRAYRCDSVPTSEGAPPAPAVAQAPAPPTVEERLAKLKELRDKGLISPEEYDKRREEILKSI